MTLDLVDLDAETRAQMRSELERDVESSTLYLSPRLTPEGRRRYPELLRRAFSDGTVASLANDLNSPGLIATHETAVRRGRRYSKSVPYTAAQTMAEGEFNRFYLRALCLSVLAFGGTELEIYRAGHSRSPRPASEAMIGRRIDARELLDDLRAHAGVDTALGLPPGPNSGLSARHVS
jgi:hypothetical protein